jgi:sulfopropanediol 3-dehydrogenase
MTLTYLKRRSDVTAAHDDSVAETVRTMLAALRTGGEDEARAMAASFDGWQGPIVVERAAIEAARSSLAPTLLDDISEAHRNIRSFAMAQRSSLQPFEIEVSPGLRAGHRLVPVNAAGCYVPAGRFAHIASALMSVTTSKVAGVETVIVTSPARDDRGGVHPAILAAADIAGADIILGLGGVQGVAALAFGLFTGTPADIIVGPGNSFVAEAKRQLFGEVGIDVIAGPTESMIIADDTADPHRVATDLVGQAEHGPDSPVWLITTSSPLAEEVDRRVPELAAQLPEPARTSALTAWEHHGEILVADDREAAVAISDEYAAEHLQVMADDLGWWHQRLTNYGSLFLGEEATVTFGDKSAGPNHILPTKRAARYTGGLNVLKFIKQLTYQELTPEAAQIQGELAARISRYEGMEGHARSADLRAEQDEASSDETGPVTLDFVGQEPLPPEAVARVDALMQSGKLFRYGEMGGDQADAALLEAEFAALVGRRYCVAFNSCGASLAAALIAAGVGRGDHVLMNAFTLAPVPGAIAHAGGQAVFVDITERYHIDLDDLRRQHAATGAKWLLLSYMRGHIPNVDDLVAVCDELDITVIEDCAHTMGASWDGRPTGTFGLAGCFSTQTFKHVNSGEGGLLVTDDEDVAARATLLSGSYMLYGQHGARPSDEVFERHRLTTPNFSMRMSALVAALVRPQLPMLADRAATWNARYRELAEALSQLDGVHVPSRDDREQFVASSIQFNVAHDEIGAVVSLAAGQGVPLKWFGAEQPVGFTSRSDHWRYADEQSVPGASAVLSTMLDMRIPLAMTSAQAQQIVAVIDSALQG